MLTWTKRKTDFGYTIEIFNDNKILTITFGGNLDLYWYLKGKEEKEVDTFEITKENYFLYSLFDTLYNDIVNCNVFKVSLSEKDFVYSLKELQNLYRSKEYLNKKLLNSEEYKKLYNGEYICWYSDDDPIEDANYVKIIIQEDKYILEFLSNKNASVL